MKVLLDSHTLLWALTDVPRLSERSAEIIRSRENFVAASAAAIWELEIKKEKGKMRFDVDLIAESAQLDFELLPVFAHHGVTAACLPLHHSDPFDRMLVAQAQIEGLTIITSDRIISRYDVAVMPAAA